MVISPKDAAIENDKALSSFIASEEKRIDEILKKEHYTGGPGVRVDAVVHKRDGLDRLIMSRYNDAGWDVSVEQLVNGTKVWYLRPTKN